MKEYAIYDIKDNEQCVYFGNIHQISEFLQEEECSLYSYISRRRKGNNRLIKHRYEIVTMEEEQEETKKSNKEIFEELLDAFRPAKVEFEIFDEFKWELKGMKDRIIVNEEWKQIPGFQYSISNYGRVRNDKNHKIKQNRFDKWLIRTDIYKNNVKYTINVCRVEAELFIRKLTKDERVVHIDGDSRNNYYKNFKIVNK